MTNISQMSTALKPRKVSLLRADSVGEWNADTAYLEKGESRSLLLVSGATFFAMLSVQSQEGDICLAVVLL